MVKRFDLPSAGGTTTGERERQERVGQWMESPQRGSNDDSSLWVTAGIIIIVAVTGKFLGSAIAARIVGQNWKDSLSIGALMS